MSEPIEVEWVGGPRDGQRFQMRYATFVAWAEVDPPTLANDSDPFDITMTRYEAPVRLTRNGYRAYYEERTA